MNVRDLVLSSYDKFKKTSKKIASVLLKNPELFLTKNVQELGEITETSAASIIRFCKLLNFKGLKDFQLQLAQDLAIKNQPKDEVDTFVAQNDSPEIIMQKLNLGLTDNFDKIASQLDHQALKQAVNLINSAQAIYLEGVAASSFAAKDLFYKFIRVGRRVYYNDDLHLALERSVYASKDDVMICFSYSGKTTELLLAAEQAKQNGTPIIAVTRNTKSPLSELADVILALPDNEQLLRVGAVYSLFSEMFISSLLYLSSIVPEFDQIDQKMKNTQQITEKLKEGSDDGD